MDDKLFMIWFVGSFAFSEPNQTERNYPFLGSWIGSHPHRFVRIVRCVVDRDAVERGAQTEERVRFVYGFVRRSKSSTGMRRAHLFSGASGGRRSASAAVDGATAIPI